MAFDDDYATLVGKFSERVAADNLRFVPESCLLPDIAPAGPVDYVLIGMEPSLGRWAKSIADGNTEVERGFRGSVWSVEDFILHLCAQEYLCAGNGAYHITDVSKGAMLTKHAGQDRNERYRKWYPLLLEELELVAPQAPRIAIGKAVHRFLARQGLPDLAEHPILHLSANAARYRSRVPREHPERYAQFAPTTTWENIKDTVRTVLTRAGMVTYIDSTLKRLQGGQGLTESRKQLMFTYLVQFEVQVQFDATLTHDGLA